MKAIIKHYLNDIVSLSVLSLMAVALIAGQAEATYRVAEATASGKAEAAATLRFILEVSLDRSDQPVSFRHSGE